MTLTFISSLDSVQLRAVDTSIPSIVETGPQRLSSSFVIEAPNRESRDQYDIRSSFYADEDTIRLRPSLPATGLPPARASGGSHTLRPDLSRQSNVSRGSGDRSSDSENYRFSHATTGSHMSQIIRGFPAPPEGGVSPGRVLSAYFMNDDDNSPREDMFSSPPRFPSSPEMDSGSAGSRSPPPK